MENLQNWNVQNDFQKNSVEIWQRYTDFRQPGFLVMYRTWMINIVNVSVQVIFVVTFSTMVFVLIFMPTHYKDVIGE